MVPATDGVANARGVLPPEGPRFATFRVEVRVAAEEGVIDPELVPPRHQLGVRVAEEAADVRAAPGESRQTQRQRHRHGDAQVVPIRGVIAGPDGTHALRAGEEGAREHERTLAVPSRHALGGGGVVIHPERVVHLAVLDAPVMHQILAHRHLRSVEHGRLVHVVPDVQVAGGPRVRVEREFSRPPVPHDGRDDVEVRGGSRPAPPVEIRPVGILDVVPPRLRLAVNRILRILLDVRVDDGHHLPAAARHVLDHALRRGKRARVPRHVPFPVGVFDVQPQNVVRHVVRVEPGVHGGHVSLVPVIPATLVIPQREGGGHARGPRQRRVLSRRRRGRGPREEENIHRAGFRHPPGVRAVGSTKDVHVRLRGVVVVHARGDRRMFVSGVREHDRDGPVESERGIVFVLEDVEVVHAVGLREGDARGPVLAAFESGTKRQARRAFGYAVHVSGARKRDVERHRGGSVRSGVLVAVERLAKRRRRGRGGRRPGSPSTDADASAAASPSRSNANSPRALKTMVSTPPRRSVTRNGAWRTSTTTSGSGTEKMVARVARGSSSARTGVAAVNLDRRRSRSSTRTSGTRYRGCFGSSTRARTTPSSPKEVRVRVSGRVASPFARSVAVASDPSRERAKASETA